MKSSLLLALVLASNVWARDPFAVPDHTRCQPADATTLSWQLQGVIGRAGFYHAWLVLPPGKALRRQLNDSLPGTLWRITQINIWGITLGSGHLCQPPSTLLLKGGKHVQDDRAVAVAD